MVEGYTESTVDLLSCVKAKKYSCNDCSFTLLTVKGLTPQNRKWLMKHRAESHK